MPRTNALLTEATASNVTGSITLHQCVRVPVLPKIQSNLTGSMVEAKHHMVEGLLQEDK